MKNCSCLFMFIALSFTVVFAQNYRALSIDSKITEVQPMTGIVFWESSENVNTSSIQLEFSYMLYSDVVSQKGVYNWKKVDDILNSIASRKHQAILRFRYEYPGENGGKTSVPTYIKAISGYSETYYKGEDGACYYPDWRNQELQSFTKEFYTKFAEKYDNDPRLAFVQTGFGHWAEYHIYGGPKLQLGVNFPSKLYQEEFVRHLNTVFVNTPWGISIDAADDEYTPFTEKKELIVLNFGLFDDSFMCEEHNTYNKYNWSIFGKERFKKNVCGGEFSYYSDYDQRNVLNPAGLYGVAWETAAAQYNMTYIIGNDQPDYWPMTRIKSAGMASGYKFKLNECKVSDTQSIVSFKNIGVAPFYYDAYPAINGHRSVTSLKGLCPNEVREFVIETGGNNINLTIESDRLLSGQVIQFTGNKGDDTGVRNDTTDKAYVYLDKLNNRIIVNGIVDDYELCVMDVSGKVLLNKHNTVDRQIDFSGFTVGTYLVRAGNNVFKIVK